MPFVTIPELVTNAQVNQSADTIREMQKPRLVSFEGQVLMLERRFSSSSLQHDTRTLHHRSMHPQALRLFRKVNKQSVATDTKDRVSVLWVEPIVEETITHPDHISRESSLVDVDHQSGSQEKADARTPTAVMSMIYDATSMSSTTEISPDEIQCGDRIKVNNALLLVQRSNKDSDDLLLSCVGVPRRTTFTIYRSSEHQHHPRLERSPSLELLTANDYNASVKTSERKRGQRSEGNDTRDCSEMSMEDVEENPKKARIDSMTEHSGPESVISLESQFSGSWFSHPLPQQKQHLQLRKLDALELLVRSRRTESQDTMMENPTTQQRHYAPNVGTTTSGWGAFLVVDQGLGGSIDGDGDNNIQGSQSNEDMMWILLGLPESATKAQDQDLFVRSSSAEGRMSNAYYDDIKNTILRAVARRGELLYVLGTSSDGSPCSPPQQSRSGTSTIGIEKEKLALSSSIENENGFVASIQHDETEQAKLEETLWLDVCSRAIFFTPTSSVATRIQGPESSNDADKDSSRKLTSTSLSNVEDTAARPLQKSTLWVSRQVFQTLVPPPLVLKAVRVDGISATQVNKLLLRQIMQSERGM
ncbi:hypothetical protein BGZ94_004026 [Podila epigama]|nr:hypothetical protein BGZ94_004026 [Podila epigama]